MAIGEAAKLKNVDREERKNESVSTAGEDMEAKLGVLEARLRELG